METGHKRAAVACCSVGCSINCAHWFVTLLFPSGSRQCCLPSTPALSVFAFGVSGAVVGNVCVLVALGRRRRITSRMHMFILHLSVADLLVALCNILPQLAWDLTGNFRGGDFLCRTVTFLQVFVMYLSTYVLVLTAIDRYRAICYPLSNHSWTPRTVNILIVGVYLLSAVLSIPQPLLFRYQVGGAGVKGVWWW
ncbi:hypothetical protein ACOMHN_014774 [Nucella lapillus]